MALAIVAREAGGTMATMLESWAHLYADSKLVATVVMFGHIGSLLMAGGLAVATDRATLRALRRSATERGRYLDELVAVHRLVLVGLALSMLTGILLFLSDVETYISSWIFWGKMGLVAILLVNGYVMTRAEQAVRRDTVGSSPSWSHLRRTALVSVGLWYTITLAGVALANIA